MLERPRLKTYLTIFPLSETTWGLRGGSDELWRVQLGDQRAMQIFGRILPYLVGRQTSDEILDALEQEGVAREATRGILEHLERSGLLEEASTWGLEPEVATHFEDQMAFFSRFTHEGGAKFQARLNASRVAVVGEGHFAGRLRRQLATAGFGTVTTLATEPESLPDLAAERRPPGTTLEVLPLDQDTIWPDTAPLPDLLFVPLQTHDPTLLEQVDAWSRQQRKPWMLLSCRDFNEGWVGPLFVPGETADYRSFEARLAANLSFYGEHRAFDENARADGGATTSLGGLFAIFDQLSSIAVVEAIKLLSEIRTPALAGKLLSVNPWSWEVRSHDVLQLPHLGGEADTSRPATFPWKEVLYAGNDG